MTNIDKKPNLDSYNIPNYYRLDVSDVAEPEVMSPSTTFSTRCPHCKGMGNFEKQRDSFNYFKQTKEGKPDFFSADIGICPDKKCNGLVFAISDNSDVIIVHPSVPIEFDETKFPKELTRTLKEAITCHSSGCYRASAMMVRRLLEETCEILKVEGKYLKDRLENLRQKGILPGAYLDAMQELKTLGNDAAHIEARDYHTIDIAEAELSIRTAQQILDFLYSCEILVKKMRCSKANSVEGAETEAGTSR